MQISVRAQAGPTTRVDLVAVTVTQITKKTLPPVLAALDQRCGGAIAAQVKADGFTGRAKQTALIYPAAKGAPSRVLLVGLGEPTEVDADGLRDAAGTTAKRAQGSGAKKIALVVPKLRRIKPGAAAQALSEGLILGSYRFDRYRKSDVDTQETLRSVALLFDAGGIGEAREGVRAGQALAEAQNLARDLSNEPANILTPVKLASVARATARKAGLRCRVLDVKQMQKLGMGAILAVGQGSANPPRMIVMEYIPPRRTSKTPTICIVGKGITFDTGGISIKPAGNMHEMKHDMSGAATVVGTMQAIAQLKVPQHVVGIIGAAENMPGGKAYRPGDVIRAMSGKTIEIMNTDAEGRVVLADALHYARKEYNPEAMVDLATLTGACVVALGSSATAIFSREDTLAAELIEAGQTAGECLWRMPLFDEHEKAMKSRVADLKNSGSREAGASTAAGFLAAFAGAGPWAHLDIAGTGWGNKSEGAHVPGATGVGVRTLVAWLQARG